MSKFKQMSIRDISEHIHHDVEEKLNRQLLMDKVSYCQSYDIKSLRRVTKRSPVSVVDRDGERVNIGTDFLAHCGFTGNDK